MDIIDSKTVLTETGYTHNRVGYNENTFLKKVFVGFTTEFRFYKVCVIH